MLKQYQEVKLDKTHMILHASLLVFNVILNLTLTAIFIAKVSDITTTVGFISLLYFCSLPLSMLFMMYVIYRMSVTANNN